ncbi:HPGD [Mytilus edulis]|uniref:15-hydroxyprostaglandin dehydrogenase [NAD(+)] n=1 Tax=Mytilus edulis TaxID=6550 RepID=A0A8S3TXH2_MYTED|nr:HPGD [Mytilus edulis]
MTVAIVTGGAKGLGKAFCEALLKRSYKVCFCDVDTDEGENTQQFLAKQYGNGNVYFQKCDVRSENDFTALFNGVLKKYSSIDLIVNNAGIIHETQWKNCVDINLNGVIQGSMLAMDHMKHGGGVIVNVSSLSGVLPTLYAPVYAATKAAVVNFTRSWAMNPAVTQNNIRMVTMCPAFADTDIIKDIKEEQFQGKQFVAPFMEKLGIMPLERVTEGFLKVLDDQDNNGKSLIVTANVMNYATFPDPFQPATK